MYKQWGFLHEYSAFTCHMPMDIQQNWEYSGLSDTTKSSAVPDFYSKQSHQILCQPKQW